MRHLAIMSLTAAVFIPCLLHEGGAAIAKSSTQWHLLARSLQASKRPDQPQSIQTPQDAYPCEILQARAISWDGRSAAAGQARTQACLQGEPAGAASPRRQTWPTDTACLAGPSPRTIRFLRSSTAPSRHYPRLRDGLVALMSGHSACCAGSALSRHGLAITGMRQLSETCVWAHDPAVVISGSLLLTQASVCRLHVCIRAVLMAGTPSCRQSRRGYAWTHQLPVILAPVEQLCVARLMDHATSAHFLDALGCLGMEALILHRQTKRVHIWAKFCLGKSGIASVTGLPRPLLDLVSRVSRGDSTERELRQFLVRSTAESRVDNQHWTCYALAALLYGHNQILPLGDLSWLFQELVGRLNRAAELASRTEDLNSRCFLWSLVMLGQMATSYQNVETVETPFRTIFLAPSSPKNQHLYDARLLEILRGEWRTDNGDSGGDGSTGGSLTWGAELGIW